MSELKKRIRPIRTMPQRATPFWWMLYITVIILLAGYIYANQQYRDLNRDLAQLSSQAAELAQSQVELREALDSVELIAVVFPPEQGAKIKSLGKFTAYAYCPCKTCSGKYGTNTATGATAKEGRTIAVDPSIIPLGSIIVVNGREYVAEDTGPAIKGKTLDIYFEDHREAEIWGKRSVEVFVYGGETK